MLFNSLQYFFFIIIAFAVYYLLPKKVRYIWLLAISYYFYMCWNAKYALLILAVTFMTWITSIILSRMQSEDEKTKKQRRLVLVISLILNFGLLVYFKYLNFIITCINNVIAKDGQGGLNTLNILLPVGISFFIFQACGYVIDVYRKEMEAEKNFLRYALFVSFFPQLVAGPIERSKNLMHQLKKDILLDGENLRTGLLYIAFGLWQKIVIADNVAVVVNKVYGDYENYTGTQILLAVVLFAFEIYCDFGGYTNIAIGSAKLFGIDLMQNFTTPYLATSPADFWRRWHISLTSWFRDYLYIPLGGNRKGAFRKHVNTLIVFLVSGFWHGAGFNFAFWGLMNGIYLTIESMIKNAKKKSGKTSDAVLSEGETAVKKSVWAVIGTGTVTWLKRIFTFILVDFTWLFFRADNITQGFDLIKRMIKRPGIKGMLLGCDLELFMVDSDHTILWIILISLVILLAVGILREKYKNLSKLLFEKNAVIRWAVYISLVLMIIVWGAYGEGYEATQFIYFQF